MGLLNTLKEIFGNKSVSIGDLNKAAILKTSRGTGPFYQDSLEDVEITNEYRLVKKLIENKIPIIFISGKAGTGKSTLIRYLRNTLEINVVVVAPTGVAALNVKGSTIHSYFRFPPRIVMDNDIKKVKDRRLYSKLDLLIIDEISMVRVEIIDAMDKFLRLNGRQNNLPFGGVQLLFVGDLFQLPPVVNHSEEEVLRSLNYDSPYFFSAKSLEHCKLIPIELGKVFRQKDSEFTDMLNKVRVAEQLNTVLPIINSRCTQEEYYGKYVVTLTSINAYADKINDTELSKLTSKSRTFIGQASGKISMENERLPSPINLILKIGAQVMFTKNGNNWVNGTVGKVISFKENSIQVQLLSNNIETIVDVGIAKWESYTYAFDSLDNKIKPYVTGEYKQFPLMLAWAITIHKSQGKTLEKIKIDIGNGAFATGQVYVALSRTRLFSDLALIRPINESDIKCDERIKRFYFAILGLQNKISQLAIDPESKELKISEKQCPYCWGELLERNGRNGIFVGCSNYPRCTYTKYKAEPMSN